MPSNATSIPNLLTWGRIFAIPGIIILFYIPSPWSDPLAGILFAIAGITEQLLANLPARRQPPQTVPPLRRPEVRQRLGLEPFPG